MRESMKRILICLLYLLIFCLWLVSPAFSQPHYTLRELCRLANENAETIKIAEEDLYRAEQEKERAKSVLIPQATLYGSYLYY